MNTKECIFPKKLMEKVINLEKLGVVEIAWQKETAVEVIDFLCDNNYVILGGDVYQYDIESNDINPTVDGWYTNQKDSTDWFQFVKESKIKAIDYINTYYKKKWRWILLFICI
jgi:hypothetical protein